MHFSQEFDDLNDLVVELRGRVGRDGMLLYTDEAYPAGTVLELDISLAEETPLIRGTAGVIGLLESPPERSSRHLAVLEFLELDASSEAFLGRLVARFESEGAELFRLERYVRRGRRGISEGGATAAAGAVRPPPTPALETVEEAVLDNHAGPRQRPSRPWRRRWPLAAALGAALAGLGAIQLLDLSSSPPLPARDPGPLLGAAVGSPPDPPTAPPGEDSEPLPDRELLPLDAVPPIPDPQGPPATRIERITWRRAGGVTVVTLEADGAIDRAAVSHGRIDDHPRPRVVLYLAGIASGDLAYRTPVGGPRLEAIRVWYHDDTSPVRLHVVLDLAGPEVTASAPVLDGRRLLVTLGPPPDPEDGARPPATALGPA